MYNYKIETGKDETFFNIDLWGVYNKEKQTCFRFQILDYFVRFIEKAERAGIALKIVTRWLTEGHDGKVKEITERLTDTQNNRLKNDLIKTVLKIINTK